MNKLIEYENRLMEYKKELNELILETKNSNNNEINNLKIQNLKNEISNLWRQIQILEKELTPVKTDKKQEISKTVKQEKAIKETKQESEKNMENLIGKILMGICASVLIFISLVSFSTVILPLLNDTIKMSLMFLVSFIFTFVGLYLLKKDNNNKLYISITGCGYGAIYVSLIVAHLYFQAFSQYILYLFIIIWIIIISLINLESNVFKIIVQFGVHISIILGLIGFNKSDIFMQYAFVVYSVLVAVLLLLRHIKEENKNYIIDNLFAAINLIVLSSYISFQNFMLDELSVGLLIIPMVASAICITLNLYKFNINDSDKFNFFKLFNIYMHFIALSFIITSWHSGTIWLLFIQVLILGIVEYKYIDVNIRKNIEKNKALMIFRYVSLFSLSIFLIESINSYYSPLGNIFYHIMTQYIILPFMIIIFMLYAFYRKDFLYKVSTIVLLIYFFFEFGADYFFASLFFIIMLGLMTMLMIKHNQYSERMKNCIYILFFLNMFSILSNSVGNLYEFLDYDIIMTITFICLSALHLCYMKSMAINNWTTNKEEKWSKKIANFINGLLMTHGLLMLSSLDNEICHLIYILILFALFSINAKELLSTKGIYIGAKYTVFMIFILNSYDAKMLFISICCIAFATVGILFGFKNNYKGIRSYGLGLALFSVVKLILFDISYNDSISKALSFFVCGLLCFVISMFYNNIDKKQKE